jgi:transcription antitermination factor NusG
MKIGAERAAARWFAVHTNARAEWMAHRRLEEHGYETLYLHFLGIVRHARRQIAVLKPYFPRYLFVAIKPGQSFGPVNRTIGVASIVHRGDEPLWIPDPVIAELRSRGNAAGLIGPEEVRKRALLKRGSEVRILQGPLEGFLATVALDDGAQIKVWLSLFGRHTTARLPSQGVELLHPNGGA